jgi:hypothetical protein
MRDYKRIIIPVAVVLVIIIVLVSLVLGGKDSETTDTGRPPLTGTLSEIVGMVLARLPDETEFTQVTEDFILQVQTQIQTGDDSKVRLDISDGSIIRLGSKTMFTFEGEEETEDGYLTRVKIELGQVFVILSGGSLDVDTPSGVASVRGSYMEVRIDPESGEIIITCLEGECTVETEGGTVTLVAGQSAVISAEDLPPELREMTEEDVQSWLENNPEATVVIVPLTATVNARIDTDTPVPTDTPAPTPTGTQQPTNTETPTVTQPPSPLLSLTEDIVCYDGPSEVYNAIGTIFSGTEVNVVGQYSGYWIVEFPGRPGVLCWVPAYAGDANDTAGSVPTFFQPPKPTKPPKPTEDPDDPEPAPITTPG